MNTDNLKDIPTLKSSRFGGLSDFEYDLDADLEEEQLQRLMSMYEEDNKEIEGPIVSPIAIKES